MEIHIKSAAAWIVVLAVYGGSGCAMPQTSEAVQHSAATVEEEPLACGPSVPPDGAVLWTRDLGLLGSLVAASVAADGAGNGYHARQETGATKFDRDGKTLWQRPGTVVTADRANHTYLGSHGTVTKLDPSGVRLWSRDVGTASIESIAVSAEGAVLVSGAELGTIALDADGRVEWTKPFGGHVALGAAALITGSFRGTVDFGAGPVTSRGRADAFIVALSPSGQHRWSHVLGDADLPIERPSGGLVTEPSNQFGNDIAEAPNGDVLVTGLAIDSIKLFGEDIATPVSSEAGVLPLAYVTRLTRAGDVIWTRRESAVREVRGLAVDARGNAIVSGGLVGNVEPHARTWIQKLDPAGALVWRKEEQFGIGFGDAVAVDRCGNIFFAVTASPEPEAAVRASFFKLRP